MSQKGHLLACWSELALGSFHLTFMVPRRPWRISGFLWLSGTISRLTSCTEISGNYELVCPCNWDIHGPQKMRGLSNVCSTFWQKPMKLIHALEQKWCLSTANTGNKPPTQSLLWGNRAFAVVEPQTWEQPVPLFVPHCSRLNYWLNHSHVRSQTLNESLLF